MNLGNGPRLIAALDIGGSKIALGLFDPAGALQGREEFPTPADPGRAVRSVGILVREMLAAAGVGTGALAGAGVACAGPLDPAAGMVLHAPNLPAWVNYGLGEAVSRELGCPAWLENDANLAALGEHRFGAGQGFADLVYVTISTGIGGGVIVANRLLVGQGDGAGELGHMTILPDGPLCNCGNRGCLEALASGPAIARRAREGLAAGMASCLPELAGGDPSMISARTVAEGAAAGDPLARTVLEETFEYLGIGLGNVITLLSPEAVIIGGGVARIGPPLIDGIRAVVRCRVKMAPVERIVFLPARLGSDAGLYGAFCLAMDRLESRTAEFKKRVRRTPWEGED